jgi:hypothetical protein
MILTRRYKILLIALIAVLYWVICDIAAHAQTTLPTPTTDPAPPITESLTVSLTCDTLTEQYKNVIYAANKDNMLNIVLGFIVFGYAVWMLFDRGRGEREEARADWQKEESDRIWRDLQ